MQTDRTFLVAALMLGVSTAQATEPPPLPVDFLTDFYIAMDGDNWHRNDGWLDPEVPACEWYGIQCSFSALGVPTSISVIRLPRNNLRGELDEALLFEMYRDAEQPTPHFILDLSGNWISGALPVLPIGPRWVDLSDNLLTGPLPSLPQAFEAEDGSLVEPLHVDRLERLDLSGNQFSGKVPNDWYALELVELDLSDNQLEGSVEPAIRALHPQGSMLRLADNRFAGTIKPEWLDGKELHQINLCWTEVTVDDPAIAELLEAIHEGGAPELCMGRERFAVDPSISGSWYNPARDGEGFSLMLLDNGTPLVYWFSHISNNRQFWLFNAGQTVDHGTRFRPILRTRGEFGLGFSDQDRPTLRGGELRLDRVGSDRLHAQFRIAYQGSDLEQPGDISITWPPMPDTPFRSDHEQLSSLAGSTCENRLPQQWISGVWFDPERDGEGFVVEVNDRGQGIVYWFTYTPAGTNAPDHVGGRRGDWQAWMMGVGSFEGDRLIVDPILRPRDTEFAMPGSTEHIVAEPWGTLILDFHNDDQGQAEFASLDEDFGGGSFPIQRLARPTLAQCED